MFCFVNEIPNNSLTSSIPNIVDFLAVDLNMVVVGVIVLVVVVVVVAVRDLPPR